MQVVIQRRRRGIFALEQLRQVETVGARCEVSHPVMTTATLLPLEDIIAGPTGQCVVAQPPNEQVITAPTVKDVAAQAAIDDIVTAVA
ncbi:hypothetical protein D9M72_630060 [compost metagenome]